MYRERVQQTGVHAQGDTVQLRGAINRAQGLGELLPLVVMLAHETEVMMNGRGLSESDIHRIMVPLAKIRSLLTTNALLGCGPDGVCREDASVRDLADRLRDIEGRIKEMRNDHARARKPPVP